MSDQTENLASPAPAIPATPENPKIPEKSHESISENANPRKTGIAEKVRSAAARVISQAGFTFKKGKGRPKNCTGCGGDGCEACDWTGKMPGKLDIPAISENEIPFSENRSENVSRTAVAAAAASDSGVSRIFHKGCKSAVKGVLGFAKTITGVFATSAGVDYEFTKKTLAKAEPEPEVLDDFTEALDAVLKKRNIQPENAEEWALAMQAGRLLAPYALLIFEFRGEMHRQRAERMENLRRQNIPENSK